ncbi:hypothetical protein HK101_009822, partial [Irineochytrium annulatum]
MNQRLPLPNNASLSFFQVDIDLSGVQEPETSLAEVVPQLVQQLADAGTNATAYLTVYPYQGYANVTDQDLTNLGNAMMTIIKTGRNVFFRYGPEMNGNWFKYGQDPAAHKEGWIRCYKFLTNFLGPNRQNVAFIWAPNSGNGYPFPSGAFFPTGSTAEGAARIAALDTNGDGVLDKNDDPYYPYYPGDEYVDWVGLSIYHYGAKWPWVNNNVPPMNEFEGLMNGNQADHPEWGTFHFYDYFSGTGDGSNGTSKGGKPFIVAEMGATYHYAWSERGIKDGYPESHGPTPNTDVSRLDMKKAWWQSIFDDDMRKRYPQMKAVCSFEFIKAEEETLRDFTSWGCPTPQQNFTVEDAVVSSAFVAEASNWTWVQWSYPTPAAVTAATTMALATGVVTAVGSAGSAGTPPVALQTTTVTRSSDAIGRTALVWSGLAL